MYTRGFESATFWPLGSSFATEPYVVCVVFAEQISFHLRSRFLTFPVHAEEIQGYWPGQERHQQDSAHMQIRRGHLLKRQTNTTSYSISERKGKWRER